MFIPETISKNTIKTYTPFRNLEPSKVLCSDDFQQWQSTVPKTLKHLSLEMVKNNWQEKPALDDILLEADKRFIIDSLSTSISLALLTSNISDDLFWKRCYKQRWPNKYPTKQRSILEDTQICYKNVISNSIDSPHAETTNGVNRLHNNWKCCFLEYYLQEYIEKLKPEEFNIDTVNELIDICEDYVERLIINQLVASKQRNEDRIPLHLIINSLPHLRHLSVCFKQTYVGDNFSWHVLQTSYNDIRNLSIGLRKANLETFRIINSDINCAKIISISQHLLVNNNLRLLDVSHCKIGDEGIVAISKLCICLPCLEELNLSNNFIGVKGVETLFYAICQNECNLKSLDLSLNVIGAGGGDLLAVGLRNANNLLEKLKIVGCGLKHANKAFINALRVNHTLTYLDLSNNNLGEELGNHLCHALTQNCSLLFIDLRMCNISQNTLNGINKKLANNYKRNNKEVDCDKTMIPDDDDDDVLPSFNEDEIRKKIDGIFDNNENAAGET